MDIVKKKRKLKKKLKIEKEKNSEKTQKLNYKDWMSKLPSSYLL